MAVQLSETPENINNEGKDINVINQTIKAETGFGSILFQIFLWLLIIPGLVFLFKKIKAQAYFDGLQQKIQENASQIDNYLEQRVQILQNVAGLVEKSTSLDKEVFSKVAQYRSGQGNDAEAGTARNEFSANLDRAMRSVNVAFEAYPELKSHATIADAMQQNSYLQKEITAARELYNNTVRTWNQDIFVWPTKKIVAAKNGYTTIIPFTASREVKEQARQKFF